MHAEARGGRVGDVEAFLHVVEAGTFSAAGRLLGLTPSAVSKTISRLEQRLGVTLFRRTTRGLVLTQEGAAYREHGARVVSSLENVERALAAGKACAEGKLVVAAPRELIEHQLVHVLPDFLASHPSIGVELVHASEAILPLHASQDVAIRIGPVHDDALCVRRLATSRPVVVGAPAYLARRGTPECPLELAQHNCLRRAGRAGANQWTFVVDGRLFPHAASGNVESDEAETLRRLALAGIGLAWLPDFMVATDVREGRLVQVLEEHQRGPEEIVSALFDRDARLPSRIRAFVDFLRCAMRDAFRGAARDARLPHGA